jgi:hypothetical protein
MAVGALVLLAALFAVGQRIERRRSRRQAWKSPYLVDEPARVDSILDEALRQRSKLTLTFAQGIMRRRPIHCALMGINESGVVVEGPDTLGAAERFAGRETTAFFRIFPRQSNPSAQAQYYSYDTTIRRASVGRAGYPVFELQLPTSLLISQRRMHMRMEPPYSYVLGLSVWRSVPGAGGEFETDREAWGAPEFHYQHNRPGVPALIDLSGGGMRLGLPSDAVAWHRLRAGKKLFVRLTLLDPRDPAGQLDLTVAADIRHVVDDATGKRSELGLQFMFQAREEEGRSTLCWERVKDDGVHRLTNWVLRRHLEIYRDKGLAD